MTTIDIIIAALLLFGFVRGLIKGLFVELASLLSLVLGIYGAIHFSDFVAVYLKNYVEWEEQYISIGAFAITFIVIVVVIALIGKLFTKIANLIALGILNKLLGGVFGLLKYALICSVILLVFDKVNSIFPMDDKLNTKEAILYQPVKNLAPSIFSDLVNISDFEIDKLSKDDQEEGI